MKHTPLTAALLGALVTASPTLANELKWSLWIPPVHPLVADLQAWADDVEAEAGDDLSITIYPAQQLGAAPDHYDMATDGIVEMAMVAPGYSPGRFPLWALIEIPFTFANATAGAQALHTWYAEYAATEMPDVKVCLITMHHPGTIHTKGQEIRTPADLSSLRIRAAGPGTSQLVSDAGGSTVQATLPEIRELAERGVIDGVTWPPDVFVIGAQDVLTAHMDAPFYITGQAHVINPAFYDGLSDKAKAALDSHCTPEWSAKVNAGWNNAETAAMERLRGLEGHNVYALTEEERATWAETVAPLTEQFLTRLGDRYDLDPTDVHDKLKTTLSQLDAAY